MRHDNTEWWLADADDDQAHIIERVVEHTVNRQLWRRDTYARFAMMYNVMSSSSAAITPAALAQRERLALNVVKSCSDAFTSKLTIEKPRVTFLTSGGDYDLQEKAKDLEKFVDGQLYEMRVYEKTPRVVLDSCVFGTGVLHVYIDGKGEHAKIQCERVHPGELFVDELDALSGDPRCLYRRKLYDKRRLIQMFPDAADDIERIVVDHYDPMWPVNYETTAHLIPIWCCWHLRSGADADDGRYAIGIKGKVLHSSEWKYDYFPFAFYRRSPALYGFWGIGLADELRGIQQEINALAQKIQRHHHLLGAGHWMVEKNSQVSTAHINNDITVINYTGTMPHVYFPQAMSGDIYQHLWQLYAKAFEMTGIDQLSASGRIPAEMQGSGKAMATYADVTSQRFATASYAYHDFFLEIARQVIDRAREIVETENKHYSVTAVSRNAFAEVEFLKVDLDETEAVLQMYPTKKLAKDPAELLAQVESLRNAFPNRIDDETALKLLDFPDLDSAQNEILASDDLCRKIVTRILKTGKVIQPRPMANLKRWVEIATQLCLRAEVQDAPEERLSALRDWIVLVENLIPKPPPPMPAGPPPPMPGGPPQPDGGVPLPAPGAAPMPGGPPPSPGAAPMPGGPPPSPGAVPMPGGPPPSPGAVPQAS